MPSGPDQTGYCLSHTKTEYISSHLNAWILGSNEITYRYIEGGIEPIVSVVSGAIGRRIRIATSTANPTEICLAWPAGVTLSCTHDSSVRGQLLLNEYDLFIVSMIHTM